MERQEWLCKKVGILQLILSLLKQTYRKRAAPRENRTQRKKLEEHCMNYSQPWLCGHGRKAHRLQGLSGCMAKGC